MNLALNAADAMPDGGKLTIETKNATLEEQQAKTIRGPNRGTMCFWRFQIRSWNRSQTMERMYDPFFTTKNRDFNKGTGLGLAIVHGIIKDTGEK